MLHVRGPLMQNCGFLSWNEFLCMLKVFNMEILVISSDVTAFGCRTLRAPNTSVCWNLYSRLLFRLKVLGPGMIYIFQFKENRILVLKKGYIYTSDAFGPWFFQGCSWFLCSLLLLSSSLSVLNSNSFWIIQVLLKVSKAWFGEWSLTCFKNVPQSSKCGWNWNVEEGNHIINHIRQISGSIILYQVHPFEIDLTQVRTDSLYYIDEALKTYGTPCKILEP